MLAALAAGGAGRGGSLDFFWGLSRFLDCCLPFCWMAATTSSWGSSTAQATVSWRPPKAIRRSAWAARRRKSEWSS